MDLQDTAATAAADAGAGNAPGLTQPASIEAPTGPSVAASGSDTSAAAVPGQAPGPIPYDRFQQVVEERNRYRDQATQHEPWTPLIQQLQQAGATPEQITQYLLQQAPQQAPDPQSGFRAWVQTNLGEDLANLDPFTAKVLERQYQLETDLSGYRQREQVQQRELVQNQLVQEMQTLSAEHPVLKDPEVERIVYAAFAIDAGNGRTLAQTATAIAGSVERIVQGRLAEYAAGKSADSRVPVTAGGASPSPVEGGSFHALDESSRMEQMASFMRAANNVG